jgi:opacity protein-like surface antigen
MNKIFVIAILSLCTGCSTVRPLAEYQHISHATQHAGRNKTNLGYNIVSAGIRWAPTEGVTVDLLEGYNFQKMHGRDEVFTGRVTVTF